MSFFFFLSPIFSSIWIFNRIRLNLPLNCAFELVIWIRIQRIFSWKIVTLPSYFANFLLQMSFFFFFFFHCQFDLNLQSNLVELTVQFCIFTCLLTSNSMNFLLSNCPIFCKFYKFSFSNVVSLPFFLPFSLRFWSAMKFRWIDCRILHLLLSFQFQFSEFSLVTLWNFLYFWQILPSNCHFFLPFSLRFRSSIEFGWIHCWIVHLHLSFGFQFSEFPLVKLSNFL